MLQKAQKQHATVDMTVMKGQIQMTRLKKGIKRYYHYYLLLLLPIVYFIVFKYLPMYGAIIAFNKYVPGGSPFGETWVGLKYFKMFFNDPTFWRCFLNTIRLSLLTLCIGFPAPIIFALLLNELRSVRYKKIVQTTSYLPHFISLVVIAGMINQLLSPSGGVINAILVKCNMEPIHFMARPEWFRTIYVISEIWQNIGWNAILYIAALSNVNTELYEASMIDGAGRFKQVIHVTIPGIMPTIVITLILTVGRLLSIGFEKVLLLYNELTYETADVISTYVYRIGIGQNNYSFATAIGLFEALIGLVLVTGANTFARKYSEASLW